ncbi:MAG: hypothetical protein Q7J68_08695, partial [Thermoplasmata archaeon]|nr:hypothetical protein [Thermoplasmata archaeon]
CTAGIYYVPVYNPQIVYVVRRPIYHSERSYIFFGTGFLIGSWLNRDCDWNQRRIYYHGWQGKDWIGRSGRIVIINNKIYVNDRFNDINHFRDKRKIKNDFEKERQRSYDYRNPGRYRNQPGFYVPVKPDLKTRPYDSWSRKRDMYYPNIKNPIKSNITQPKNQPGINNNRGNQGGIIRSAPPSSGNRPELKGGPIRSAPPGSGNQPGVKGGRNDKGRTDTRYKTNSNKK